MFMYIGHGHHRDRDIQGLTPNRSQCKARDATVTTNKLDLHDHPDGTTPLLQNEQEGQTDDPHPRATREQHRPYTFPAHCNVNILLFVPCGAAFKADRLLQCLYHSYTTSRRVKTTFGGFPLWLQHDC